MKDVRAVLCQKEKDAERVRREVQALLTVIPLLADGEAVSGDRKVGDRLARRLGGTCPTSR